MPNRFYKTDTDEEEPEKRSTKDNVHGIIDFNYLVWSVIDTPQFQRLREIKQLGVSYRVFVSASHNRFEHCLGVAHLAGELARHLQQQQPELKITDRDVSCVELAGLCHDLGHGPWSHVWDNMFIPAVLPGVKWSHEEASEMMFDDLIATNNISIPREDVDFIKDLIRGAPNHSKRPEKPFLFEIVANRRNGIDVDKFDYIQRDTKAIGLGHSFDTKSIIDSARVIGDEICYNIKMANNLFEICYTRFSLHKRIYNHKTARAIELMIIDALKLAEPHMKIAQRIRDPKKYLHLTDNIMQSIKMSEEACLEQTRHLFWRIDTRDLYRCVDFKAYDWQFYDRLRKWFTEEAIVKKAKELYNPETDDVTQELVDKLDKSHVIVDICRMHYGMKEHNPLDSVRFYSKRNTKAKFKASRGDSSTLMPSCFGECLIRVYTRDPDYFGLIHSGYNGILDKLDFLGRSESMELILDHLRIPDDPDSADNLPPTPVDTIPTQSRNVSFSSAVGSTGTPRTPSGSGSFIDRMSASPPRKVGDSTPFSRNLGMQVSKNFAPKGSPQKSGRRRPPLGGSSSLSTLPESSSSKSPGSGQEQERDDGGPLEEGVKGSTSKREVKAGNLMPAFMDEDGSPSPEPSSVSRRHVAHALSVRVGTTGSARKAPTPRGGQKKKRNDTELDGADTDVDIQNGSPVRKKHKR